MTLHILGSGSKGNSYLLKPENGKSLIIDCGVSFLIVKKEVDFDLKSICCAIQGHSHGDHSKYTKDFLNVGIDVYMTDINKKEIGLESHNIKTISPLKTFKVDDFVITPFELKHDVFCVGFQIYHPECGKLIYITDTNFCEYTFDNVNQFIVEANFCHNILESKFKENTKMKFLHDRILRNHFSLKDCKNLLLANDLKNVVNIVLIHLSDSNSHEKRFIKEVFELTGKTTMAASAGMKIEFNLMPF